MYIKKLIILFLLIAGISYSQSLQPAVNALNPADFSGGKFIQESNGAFVPKTLAELRGYKVYTALLTQTGENAPTASVLQNDFGEITFTYVGVGLYTIESSGLFTTSKTVALILNHEQLADGNAASVEILTSTANLINIITYADKYVTPSNEELNNTPIEIRVYY